MLERQEKPVPSHTNSSYITLTCLDEIRIVAVASITASPFARAIKINQKKKYVDSIDTCHKCPLVHYELTDRIVLILYL